MNYCRLIQVIETDLEVRGDGTKDNPSRRVRQYYSTDGELLAEVDSWADRDLEEEGEEEAC